MKKRILIVGGILIAAGALGTAGWYYFQSDSKSSGDGETVYVSTVSSITGSASGVENRFAGVVEPQKTVEVKIESGRKVKEVKVKAGQEVKEGQLLFEYDLSSIQEDLQEAKLALDRLKNEALSLTDQIGTLEAEKKKASADNQLSYTIEIETNRMNLKKNEYDQKTKEAQIQKLSNATSNTEVRSELEGIIQKIDTTKMSNEDGDTLDEGMDDESMNSGSGNTSDAFITILSTGAYRIKGKVNEQNRDSVIPGEPVIIRSRVDENQTWRGTMGAIDEQNASTDSSNNNMMYYGMGGSSDSQTTSSSYPFYIELDSSDGLMLGQHVYIEKDNGQEDKKDNLWLSEFYILDADSAEPYVWAASDDEKLEKRSITLGQYDETMGEYEIVDGLTEKDCIAFPAEMLTEGMPTVIGDISQTTGQTEGMDEFDGIDMEQNSADEPEMIEEPSDDLPEDFSNEDLVPMDEAPGGGTSDAEAVG